MLVFQEDLECMLQRFMQATGLEEGHYGRGERWPNRISDDANLLNFFVGETYPGMPKQ